MPEPNMTLTERANALPDNVRGAFWMILSALAFAAMGALIKILGQEMHGFQVAFFRALFGALVLAPFIFRPGYGGFGILKTERWRLHLLRVTIGTGAMLCIFYAITQMELATATAIAYARPLFLVVLAVIFLQEPVRWRRWAATAVGFLGVMLILQPGADTLQPAAIAALTAAVFMAASMVCIKKLSDTERPLTMLAWFAVASIFTALIPSVFVWVTPSWGALGLAVIMGSLGSLGQYCVIRAFRIGEATAVVPFDYSQIPFAWAWGFFLFGEQPSIWTWAGAAVIVSSSLYILHREARLRRSHPMPQKS